MVGCGPEIGPFLEGSGSTVIRGRCTPRTFELDREEEERRPIGIMPLLPLAAPLAAPENQEDPEQRQSVSQQASEQVQQEL